MHLLVLSAFRLDGLETRVASLVSQCTFWCSVLSDLKERAFSGTVLSPTMSQCTFWCSVLSDTQRWSFADTCWSLNAPFGAQCFPTWRRGRRRRMDGRSQCTFWCSVLSDTRTTGRRTCCPGVSMHLLVLSAFRRLAVRPSVCQAVRLNAPFGAQCFPTRMRRRSWGCRLLVSMHLLVLSAFRLKGNLYYDFSQWSQCTFWCSVLSDPKRKLLIYCFSSLNAPFGAQCFPT